MRAACPSCERDTDFALDVSVEISFCEAHALTTAGADDAKALAGAKGPGQIEMTGAEIRAACNWIHRGRGEPE